METKIKIRNKFEFIKKNIITGKKTEKETSYNIVTNNGLDHFLNHNRNIWKYMHFGTGAGIPTEENFSMFSWLAQKTVTRETYYYEDEFKCWVGKYKAVITANTYTGVTITEVGLSSSTNDGSLCTHSMENETGGVLGITIEENEEITVYAYLYITTEDSEGFIWAKNSNNFIRNMLWESSNHHYILPMKHKKITNYTTPQDKGYSTYTASGNQNLASTVTVDDTNKVRQYKILIEPTYAPNEYIKGFQISDSSPTGGHSQYYDLGGGFGGGFGYIPLPIQNSNTQENLIGYKKLIPMDGTTLEHKMGTEFDDFDKERVKVYVNNGTNKELLTEGVDFEWGKYYSHSVGVSNFSIKSYWSFNTQPIPYLAYNGRQDSPIFYLEYSTSSYDTGDSNVLFTRDVTGQYGDKRKIKVLSSMKEPFVLGRQSFEPWMFPLGHYDNFNNLLDTNLYLIVGNDSVSKTLFQKNKEENPISNDYNTNIVPLAVYDTGNKMIGAYINKDLGKILTFSSKRYAKSGDLAFYEYRITASDTLEMAILNSEYLAYGESLNKDSTIVGQDLIVYGEKYPSTFILTGHGDAKIYTIDWINNTKIDITSSSLVDDLGIEIPFMRLIKPNEDWTKMYTLEGENFSDYNICTYNFDNLNMKLGEKLDSFNLSEIGITSFSYSVSNLNVSKDGTVFNIIKTDKYTIIKKEGENIEVFANASAHNLHHAKRFVIGKTNDGIPVLSANIDDYRFHYNSDLLKLNSAHEIGDIVSVEDIYQPYLWKHENNRMELTVKVKYLINQT